MHVWNLAWMVYDDEGMHVAIERLGTGGRWQVEPDADLPLV